MEKAISKNKNWYPVCTQSRAEKKAHQHLCRNKITSYLPLDRKLKQWSDRKKWVEEPLIRSYLFVHISPDQMKDVLMTPGIARFIYFSGKISTIPDQQIEHLRLLTSGPYTLEVTEEALQPGEKITIKAGILQGITGEVIEYKSQKRLLLRLNDLNNSIIVHVPAALIERI